MRNRRRKEVEIKKRRRRTFLLTVGILLALYFIVAMVFGEKGLLKYYQLKSLQSEVLTEIEALKRRNREINRQIETAKKDSGQMEELARRHGLSRDGELIFKFEEKQQLQ